MRIAALIFMLLFPCALSAQNASVRYTTAYKDYRNYLYTFQEGIPIQLESQPVRSFKSGGEITAYVNSANNLIVWYNGEKTDLEDASTTNYTVNNSLLIYLRDKTLAVFDQGKLYRLSYFTREYKANEGMIAFRDENIDILKVYYKGKVVEIENTLIGSLGIYKVGKNTIAYINSSNYFKVYHDGESYELDNIPPLDFECGKDIVAYIDGTYQSLKTYYNNKVLTLENIKPQSFQSGDGIVAYVSDEGYFKIFTAGKLVKAESYPPDFYIVRDSCVLFYVDNKFQVLLNGTRVVLDNFKPNSYKISQNNIAWADLSGRLHLYSNGKIYEVTSELFTGYELNGDILRYDLPGGISKIFYKGKTN